VLQQLRERALRMDQRLLLVVAALAVLGIVMVLSASFPVASRSGPDGAPGDPFEYLKSHLLFAVVGLVGCVLAACLPLRAVRGLAVPLFAVAAVLMVLVFVPPIGAEPMGGAHRWIHLPMGRFFQPSELAKVAIVLLLAWCASRAVERGESLRLTYGCGLGAAALMGGLCVAQRDLGSAVVCFLLTVMMLFLAGVRLETLLLPLAGGVLGALALAWKEPYRWQRVTAFLDPEADMQGSTYHVIRMLLALARGGIFGVGLGRSPEKWYALPARHTDSIFCVIGGELGFIGGVVVIAAFVWLAWRSVRVARSQNDAFGRLLASGLGCGIALQALVNIGVATGSLPCTGLTLPLISYGGSSLLMTLLAAGLLFGLSAEGRQPTRADRPAAAPRPAPRRA